jgi:hypothetical protein
MDPEHLPRTCRWAKPTLLLEWPDWLNAWSSEWSCENEGGYRPLAHSECCRSCPRWEAASDGASTPLASSHDRTMSCELL